MSEALFRVGGVYRAVNGSLYRLCPLNPDDKYAVEKYAGQAVAWSRGATDGYGCGFRSLVDGCDTDPQGVPGDVGCRNLIPGELVERDGQWVPIDPIVVYKPAQYTQRSESAPSLEAAQIARDKNATQPAVKWVPPAVVVVVKAPRAGTAANPHESPFIAKTLFRSPDVSGSHQHLYGSAHLLPKD